MTSKLESRLISQLKEKGDTNATLTARKLLIARGHVDKSGKLTAEGKKREDMGASGRAIDRKSKETGKAKSDYAYNHLTNRAVLKNNKSNGYIE